MRRLAVVTLAAVAFSSPPGWSADDLALRARLATDYVALKERPLFAPDRTAPVPFAPPEPEPVVMIPQPEPEPPPPASAPDWQLVGLVRSDKLNSATFTTPNGPAAFSLRAGESRDGWTLKEVGRFEVTLDGAGGRALLRFPAGQAGGEPMPGMVPEMGIEQGAVPVAVPEENQAGEMAGEAFPSEQPQEPALTPNQRLQ